jgi:hypothetical protein
VIDEVRPGLVESVLDPEYETDTTGLELLADGNGDGKIDEDEFHPEAAGVDVFDQVIHDVLVTECVMIQVTVSDSVVKAPSVLRIRLEFEVVFA